MHKRKHRMGDSQVIVLYCDTEQEKEILEKLWGGV